MEEAFKQYVALAHPRTLAKHDLQNFMYRTKELVEEPYREIVDNAMREAIDRDEEYVLNRAKEYKCCQQITKEKLLVLLECAGVSISKLTMLAEANGFTTDGLLQSLLNAYNCETESMTMVYASSIEFSLGITRWLTVGMFSVNLSVKNRDEVDHNPYSDRMRGIQRDEETIMRLKQKLLDDRMASMQSLYGVLCCCAELKERMVVDEAK